MEQAHSLRADLPQFQSTRLAASAADMDQQEMRSSSSSRYSSASKRTCSHVLSQSRQDAAIPASPVQRSGSGPPTSIYSISRSAHSTELRSPCSQAAKSDRTSSRLAEDTPAVSSLRDTPCMPEESTTPDLVEKPLVSLEAMRASASAAGKSFDG